MAYPIQPAVVSNSFRIDLNSSGTAGPVSPGINVTAYVTSITCSLGGERDNYFFQQSSGSATVTMYDTGTLLNNSSIAIFMNPGMYVCIMDIQTGSSDVFTATMIIRDSSHEYVWDDVKGEFVYVTTLQCEDAFSRATNYSVDDYKLFSTTAETQTLEQFMSKLNTATSSAWNVTKYPTGKTVNQFVQGGTVTGLLDRVSKGTGTYFAVDSFITSLGYGRYNYWNIPTSVTPVFFLTDGTHTSQPAGTTLVNYTGIEYGQTSERTLSDCTFNNYGLDRAPGSTGDRTVVDVVVPYTSSQSLGYVRKAEFDSAVATNNIGWNLIKENGCGKSNPTTWATTGTGTWKITRPSQSVMSLNDHGVYRCKVVASGGVAAGAGFLLMDIDPEYDIVTNFPGGATVNNWIASVKIRVTTSRTLRLNINWYDADGNSTGTTTGTNTVINTGSWVTLSTQCSTANVPANSVTGVPAIYTNLAMGQYGYFFATEVLWTRTNVASTFFDGDTPDDASYTYTWTGAQYASPAQKNTNTIKTYTDALLARNTIKKRATRVTVNATQALTRSDMFKRVVENISRAGNGTYYNTGYVPVSICVNGTNNNYLICGVDFAMNPTDVEANFNVVDI